MDDLLRLLASAVATLLTIVAPATVYILRRVRSLETENAAHYREDQAAKDARIAELESRLTTMEVQAAKVPDLERQVDTLCKQIGALQAQYDQEHNVNAQLEARIATVTQERDTALAEVERLQIERDAFQRILIAGAALAQKESTDTTVEKSAEYPPAAQEKNETP